MLRSILFLSLGLFALDAQHAKPQVRANRPQCANTIVHEPLVVFESTGGTLMGAYDLELVVYNDGQARLSSSVKNTAMKAVIDPLLAQDFAARLERAGGMTGCDRPHMVTDMPLSTLTMMSGDPSMPAHTFSWWYPDEPIAEIDALIDEFIAGVFPKF